MTNLVDDTSLNQTITSALGTQVAERPNKVALDFGGARWSFSQLEQRVSRVAGGLAARGVEHGDRVTVFAGSIPEQIVTFLAVARLGAINAPINAQWTESEARHVLHDAETKVLIVNEDTLDRGLAAAEGTGVKEVIAVRRAGGAGDLVSALRAGVDPFDVLEGGDPTLADSAAPTDPVALFYTSGTTGKPKGATWSHRNLLYNSLAWMEVFGVGPDDVALGGYDGRGSGISIGVTGPLCVGATILSPARDGLDPTAMIRAIADAGVTYMPTAPAIMSILMVVADQAGIDSLPSVRVIAIGSAATPPDMFEPLHRFLPNCRIYHSYGASEGHFSTCPPEALPAKAGSVGVPLPRNEIRVVDEQLRDVALGEVGRVAVRGPGAMAGYWKQPEATANALRDGWLLMGDIGRLDEDGYLWLVGRDRDVINSGGWNVYASEVEAVLSSVPGVQYVAVLGRADERLSERVTAYVSPFPGQTVEADALQAACEARLAKYKRPRVYHVKESLPINANLKVQKHLIED